jgi:hypothetical protein
MSKTNITSKNQSGGITAQNVTLGRDTNHFNTPNADNRRKWKKIIFIVGGIIAFLASVVTILAYFDIYPFNKN